MIEKLKRIYQTISLPHSATKPPVDKFKIKLINEPYLYVNPTYRIQEFDSVEHELTLPVFNAGLKSLKVNTVRIPRREKSWVKRTRSSDSEQIKMVISLNKMPNSNGINIAEVQLTSNSISRTFSKCSLSVKIPSSSSLLLPEIIDFGLITACQISVIDQDSQSAQDKCNGSPRNYLLIGNFHDDRPLECQIDHTNLHQLKARVRTEKTELFYTVDSESDGQTGTSNNRYKETLDRLTNDSKTSFASSAVVDGENELECQERIIHQSTQEPAHEVISSIESCDKQVEIVEEGSRSLDEVSHIVDAVPSNDKQELQNANEGNWQLVEAITGGGRKLRIHSSKLNLKLHNVGKTDWAGEVKSDTPWVKVTEKLKIDCLTASTLPLSLNLSELQVGTNTGYVIIGNDRIPVWATLRVINNFTFDLKDDPQVKQASPNSSTPLPVQVSLDFKEKEEILIFEDIRFQVPCQTLESIAHLVGDFNQWNPFGLMMEQSEDSFHATISIPDGNYLYRVEVDGEMRIPISQTNRIVFSSKGFSTSILLQRNNRQVTILNKSDEELVFTIKSSKEWLEVRLPEVTLKPRQRKEIIVSVRPEFLELGRNCGTLVVEEVDDPKRVSCSEISLTGIVNGAVPVLCESQIDFNETGSKGTTLLNLHVLGKGKLKLGVLPQSLFQLSETDCYHENEFQISEMTPFVSLNLDRVSNVYYENCYASLVNNCYLVNRRTLPFTAQINLTALDSKPSAVYFPHVPLYGPLYTSEVKIGYRKEIGDRMPLIEFEVPEPLRRNGVLQINRITSEIYHFIFDPKRLSNPQKISGVVQAKDRLTGLSSTIWVSANVISGNSRINIDCPSMIYEQDSSDALVIIENIGQSNLSIFDFTFENNQFYCAPYLPQNRIIEPDESLEIYLKPTKQGNLFKHLAIHDQLTIHLNDAQYPNGLFQQKLCMKLPALTSRLVRGITGKRT